MRTLDPLARTYARALADLAQAGKPGALAAVARDVEALGALIAESADLAALLRSPLVEKTDVAAVLAAIAKRAGFQDLTARFLRVMARRGRARLLPQVVEALAADMAARRGEVTARVESAVALTAKQQKALAQALTAARGGAGQVTVDNVVDPAVLGGLVVTVGSVRIDDSLRGKLARLENRMQGARAA